MKQDILPTDLTNEEKSDLLQGTDFMYTAGVPRLGIPRLSMADGPHGLRKQIDGGDNGVSKSEPATAFPTAACVASSWDPENAEKIGRAIGEECRYYGVHILLGPGVNIKRNPLCGRNFEYYSEDPLLAGKFGAAFVRGVQENGVSACVKHFALNNQENFRFVGNSVADERAIREIYLKPFEITVREGKPGALMSSYNRINGTFASENRWLLTDVLREEWGFDGIVMSDWGGTHDRVAGVRAGEDLEMPGDTAVNRKAVYDALEDGSLSEEDANLCLGRLLATTARLTAAEKADSFDREAHARLAAKVATDSAVLMKNDGTLPLDRERGICVIGDLFANMRYQGSGSSMISPTSVVTHKDAFDARNIRYEYARGYSAGAEADGAELAEEAVRLAGMYDTVLLYLGLTDFAESEGGDRVHMRLPEDQLTLTEALIATGKRIVVVLSGGSPVELPFSDRVCAILNLYLPGQCGGEAGARLIFGEENPSGKLAETWYRRYEEVPYAEEYSKKTNELYKESIFIGYRYTETAKIRTAFPFGFGLSYTTFSYENPKVTKKDGNVEVSLTVRNTGGRAGRETVELYVKNNADGAVFKPEKELRAFTKISLAPGEEKTVHMAFSVSELAFYDVKAGKRRLENGEYTIEIGASCEDIRLTLPLPVTEGTFVNSPYPEMVNDAVHGAKTMNDVTFSKLVGAPLPTEPPTLPLTLESRFFDFQNTFMGSILYKSVCSVAKRQMKKAKKLPQGTERDNCMKGAIFLQRIFDTNCVRTLSFSGGKSFPWNLAEGFVLLGNGHPFRGVRAMCKSYRIKGEKRK